MPAPDFIASPDSVPGQLQRGQGEGYRRILLEPRSEAHAMLTECITRDPRVDSQVESRGFFYASIAVEIDLPLEPLAAHLRKYDEQNQDSWSTALTVTTLAELAKRNHRNARKILCDYISWGQWWESPLDDLLGLSDTDLVHRIARAIELHFPSDDALDDAMKSWACESFAQLSARSPRIEASTAKAKRWLDATPKEVLPDLTELSPQELLNLANQKNYIRLRESIKDKVRPEDGAWLISRFSLAEPFATHIALAGLERLALPSLADRLLELWATTPMHIDPVTGRKNVAVRQGLSRAILALPAEFLLPVAREWMVQEDTQKRDLAVKILIKYARPEDVRLLRKGLPPMLESEEAEYDCFLIKAFFRLPGIGVVQELVDIFHQFRFSWGRVYATEAIQITSPEFFQENLALECLWDCEEEIRVLGVKSVSLDSSEALKMLRRMANDPFESEIVRDSAKQRL